MSKPMSIGEAATYVGVSRDTLRRWEKSGKITPERSPTNRRYYTKELLDTLLKKPVRKTETEAPRIVKQPTSSLKLVYYTLGALALAVMVGLAITLFLF
ncbi:MAG: helix-turn-helix domain-containing protein [Dehalococcoidales bacterium]|nr:helix-turn-helix domain-containing protein [Dehalococcoidales bacterium]